MVAQDFSHFPCPAGCDCTPKGNGMAAGAGARSCMCFLERHRTLPGCGQRPRNQNGRRQGTPLLKKLLKNSAPISEKYDAIEIERRRFLLDQSFFKEVLKNTLSESLKKDLSLSFTRAASGSARRFAGLPGSYFREFWSCTEFPTDTLFG